jgi:hypothetical protein
MEESRKTGAYVEWRELRGGIKNVLVGHKYQLNDCDLLYFPFDFMDHYKDFSINGDSWYSSH